MMKKCLAALTALILCFALSVFAFARDPYLWDEEGLVTETEQAQELDDRLYSVSQTYSVDVIIVTVDGLDGLTPAAFAGQYYDEKGFGQGENHDGVMLLVSMEERDWYVLTNGFGHTAITDDEVQYIGDRFVPYLSEGDYYGAFNTFIDECEYEINGEINGFPFEWGVNLLIALVVGLVAALIVTGIWRGQLKSVARRLTATEYTKSGSMQVTHSQDLYLYRTVNRTRKVKNTSTGSGGGGSRGGGGGKF